MSIDIVFAGIPYTEGGGPLMAPAYLKSICKTAGYNAVGLDLNIEFLLRTQDKPWAKHLRQFAVAGVPKENNLHNFKIITDEYGKYISGIVAEINYMADRILSYDPKHIGLSLLTHTSQGYARWLCVRLRQLAPDKKIVIGGAGIAESLGEMSRPMFAKEMKELGLIDHYITGDAERSLIEYLKGNLKYTGIDSPKWEQIKDLSEFPYPDYSDYDFSKYIYPAIPIQDSNGCIRTCDFCDVIVFWKKYTFKQASQTFDEMIYQYKKYGIRSFSMRNSLTNGSIREFQKWVKLLAEYNNSVSDDEQLHWKGFFICRSKEQHPEEMFELIKQSNGTLYMGIETAIERVRWEMNKKFTNDDIVYHLDLAKKYKIPVHFMMMVGYISETREDYQYTKQWIDSLKKYSKNPIMSWWVWPAMILPNTELEKKAKEKSDNIDIINSTSWQHKGNNAITFKERQQQFEDIQNQLEFFRHSLEQFA